MNSGRDLNAYFSDIDKRKIELASEEAEKKKAEDEERRKNGNKKGLFNFSSEVDASEIKEFSEAELELIADKKNAKNLTVDSEGRIVRIDDVLNVGDAGPAADKKSSKKKKTNNKKDDSEIISIDDNEEQETDAPKIDEAERRKEALRNALSQEIDEDEELDMLPVEDIDVLMVETMSYSEAKLYIATAYNAETNESAYGYYLEQGSGRDKRFIVGGEKYLDVLEEPLGYLAAAQGISLYASNAGEIKDVTILSNRDISWNLYHNSWQVEDGNSYPEEAGVYSQYFVMCSNQGVEIHITFEEVDDYGYQFAKNIAEALVASA